LQNYPPRNPFELITNAYIVSGANTDQGIYLNSSTFANPALWVTSPFAISAPPVVAALGTDSIQNIADANQWNFDHLTWNSSTQLAPPLRNMIFLRVGAQWQNNIAINLGGLNYSDLQLGFLDNAGTRGDYAGTYPVISWTARAYTGAVTLELTASQAGQVRLGLRGIDGAGNYSMFEIVAIFVP